MPKLSPRYEEPVHLAPLLEVLEGIRRGEQHKVVVHTPPRHGKTETLLHAISWLLMDRPDWTIGYCSYNEKIAYSKSRVARQLAQDAGIRLPVNNVGEWRTKERGGCLATGIGGTLTGQGLNVGIVDDPVKNRAEAESAVMRESTWAWFTDTFLTRIEPGGSVIVNMARWHPDDLAGRLVSEKGWRYICLPALTEHLDGSVTSLWHRWSVAELLSKKADLGIYSWESLFQGQPRPRGGAVFGDPVVWDALPSQYRVGMGIDLAYTAKSSSDYAVLVVMFRGLAVGEDRTHEGLIYVTEVVRAQKRAPEFLEVVKRYAKKYPTARIRFYGAGTETGSADFFRKEVPRLEVLPALTDKFTRAINYAAGWNAGRVLVPADSELHPWVNQYIVEHVNFTGVEDSHDDQVDAAVAAYDVLAKGTATFEGLSKVKTERRM